MKPKILVVHTFYLQRGGEDQAFRSTVSVLESLGYPVETLTFDNCELEGLSGLGKLGATIWNAKAADKVEVFCREHNIAAVHLHNTFPVASPAVYSAIRRSGAKVLQWIHNYRLLCPSSSFFRDGKVCEDCASKTFSWPGIVHACYRQSRAATAAVAAMKAFHSLRGTWMNEVDCFLVYTDFVRNKLAQYGLPSERIRLVPTLVTPDPGPGTGGGGYGIYVGRLTFEKGARLLMDALDMAPGLPFKIIGSGPMADDIKTYVAARPHVEYVSGASNETVRQLVSRADFMALPSLWYEGGGPLTAAESLANGTPLVAANIGNLPHYAIPGLTGLLFEAGNSASMAAAMMDMMAGEERRRTMRLHCRENFEQRFTFDAQKHALDGIMQEIL